jgi:hypothetical protein
MKLNTWKNHFESRRSGLIIAFSLIFCATRIASAQSWTQLVVCGEQINDYPGQRAHA